MQLNVEAIPINPKWVHPPAPHPVLLDHPFTLGFAAAKGAGKTTTIVRLLEFYAGYFHRIYICAPTVKNDPKWQYIMNKPKMVKRNVKLERWLAKNKPELLKKREKPFGEDADDDGGYQVETLGSKSKRKKIDPTIVGDGRRRFLRTEEGTFLNKNKGTCVMVRPLSEEHRRPIYDVVDDGNPFSNLQSHSNKWYQERINKMYPVLSHKWNPERTVRDPYENEEDPEELEDALYPKGALTDKCVFADDAPAKLKMIMDNQDEIICALEKDGKTIYDSDRILIIFDDMVGSDLFSKAKDSQAFTTLQARHRHFNISQVVVVQAYKAVSKTTRINLSGLILFKVHNQKELEVIYEENPCCQNYPEWEQIYKWATDEKHSFLFINYQKDDSERMWKCFKEPAPLLLPQTPALLSIGASLSDPLSKRQPEQSPALPSQSGSHPLPKEVQRAQKVR